jgi:hypothetical protein
MSDESQDLTIDITLDGMHYTAIYGYDEDGDLLFGTVNGVHAHHLDHRVLNAVFKLVPTTRPKEILR